MCGVIRCVGVRRKRMVDEAVVHVNQVHERCIQGTKLVILVTPLAQ